VNPHPIPTLIYEVFQTVRARHPERPALIGVTGAQGSGKTHACRLLEAANRPRFAHFSLDDTYLTRAERERLARDVHPLFVTRGPPGTHDLTLIQRTIDSLRAGRPTPLPRFDKARDDRIPESEWPVFQGRAESILIDGWCLGALPPEDSLPLNQVEREDADGSWRATQRAALAGPYADLFNSLDAVVLLLAPSWEIVRRWRGQQEEATLRRPLTSDDNARLDRFIQHFERITRSMLAGGHRATHIVRLDESRAPAANESA
jgi:D-glycerate 3-kinase